MTMQLQIFLSLFSCCWFRFNSMVESLLLYIIFSFSLSAELPFHCNANMFLVRFSVLPLRMGSHTLSFLLKFSDCITLNIVYSELGKNMQRHNRRPFEWSATEKNHFPFPRSCIKWWLNGITRYGKDFETVQCTRAKYVIIWWHLPCVGLWNDILWCDHGQPGGQSAAYRPASAPHCDMKPNLERTNRSGYDWMNEGRNL